MAERAVTEQALLDAFAQHEGTDLDYLRWHIKRFLDTYERFNATWDPARGTTVLDIGAHWLHQSMVFRLAGYEVIAADLPVTMEREAVQRVAQQHGIQLLSYPDLSVPGVFSAIADASVHVVVLAEIIEHITFNPVELWKEIHRVTAPGGRIIVTTPNYYRPGGYAWRLPRFLAGGGGGIPVKDILGYHTLAHHWKEYSRKELVQYFALLSADFSVVKCEYTLDEHSRTLWLQKWIKGIRQGLHMEIELRQKANGIQLTPEWG